MSNTADIAIKKLKLSDKIFDLEAAQNLFGKMDMFTTD